MMMRRKTNAVRFRYRGALARPLGPGESLHSKIPLLLADLRAANKDEGFDKLAERHVPGCQRGKAGRGKRRLDPATLAQFFEAVDDIFHAAVIEGRGKPSITSSVEAVLATLDSGHPIRSYSKQTMITYYKNQDEIELTYQRALEESLKALRDRFDRSKGHLSRTELAELERASEIGREMNRVLGPPDDLPRRRLRRHRGRK